METPKRKPAPAGKPTPPAIGAPAVTPPATQLESPPAAPTPSSTPPATTADDLVLTDGSRSGEMVDAAVLVAFGDHAPDDIVTAPAAEIEQLQLAGKVDSHPDAVAFARSLAA